MTALITAKNLTIGYKADHDNAALVVQKDLNFAIESGQTVVIMGPSGCGKSTLMRHLIGLEKPLTGTILRNGIDIWDTDNETCERLMRASGVMFQSGGLWTSMTIAENIATVLQEFTELSAREIREVVQLKLALVGLAGCESLYPAELSGGMIKRAGIARAMALDPELLFLDEPSSGLDPISARRLDNLINHLRENLKTTFVIVTHDLESIFTIATTAFFLDDRKKTLTAIGDPAVLRDTTTDPYLRQFLTRS